MAVTNTHGADINELSLGFYLNGGQWFSPESYTQFCTKKKLVSAEELVAQMGRAKAMADTAMAYFKEHYRATSVKQVFWTARMGSLAKAVGMPPAEIDQRKNPTDILVLLNTGDFIGLSAKSTAGHADIGFKNPGLGTVEGALKLKLGPILEGYVTKACKQFKLSSSPSTRKIEIRNKPAVQAATQALGALALTNVRDVMYRHLTRMEQKALRRYLLNYWMDANTSLYPPYLKVTGMGDKMPYTAKIEDPLANPKLSALQKKDIKLEKVGDSSIGVLAGGKHILKMRAKFESEKLASPFKFSGEPF